MDEILNLIESVSDDFPSYSYEAAVVRKSHGKQRCFLEYCYKLVRLVRMVKGTNVFVSSTCYLFPLVQIISS